MNEMRTIKTRGYLRDVDVSNDWPPGQQVTHHRVSFVTYKFDVHTLMHCPGDFEIVFNLAPESPQETILKLQRENAELRGKIEFLERKSR